MPSLTELASCHLPKRPSRLLFRRTAARQGPDGTAHDLTECGAVSITPIVFGARAGPHAITGAKGVFARAAPRQQGCHRPLPSVGGQEAYRDLILERISAFKRAIAHGPTSTAAVG